jgi:hypothetical protein
LKNEKSSLLYKPASQLFLKNNTPLQNNFGGVYVLIQLTNNTACRFYSEIVDNPEKEISIK